MNYLKKRGNAFVFAIQGLAAGFKRESHLQFHLIAAVLVSVAGFYFRINYLEWCILLACIFLVIICEIINTAIEKLCDVVTYDIHPTIKYIKDISAAAVLLACIFSIIAGILVLGPYLLKLFY
jgi:diacylglycerol kinase